ncbi:MAG: HlyD family efflux transporter periplasmic adaptor subunit [Planctomycetaceae bacterium]|nr:MAG: HlyD family efflux transporter periplasmic adaptor subunit [Planctomycetaceae bacterium]
MTFFAIPVQPSALDKIMPHHLPSVRQRSIPRLAWCCCGIVAVATFLEQPAVRSEEPASVTIAAAVVTLAEQVEVAAAEAGIVAEVRVRPGQMVETDSPIARLRDDDAELSVERTRLQADIAARQAESDLDELHAKKSTEVARAELARAIEANAKYPKTVSQTELDRQQLLVEQGELETRRAEHERRIAGLNREVRENEHQLALHQLNLRRLSAPIPGMVVEVHRRPGEWVQPGDVVARIVRLDRLRVEGFLPASQGRAELVGRLARVETVIDDSETLTLSGEVVFVSPEIDPIDAHVRVWIDVENSEHELRPGMTVSVTVLNR